MKIKRRSQKGISVFQGYRRDFHLFQDLRRNFPQNLTPIARIDSVWGFSIYFLNFAFFPFSFPFPAHLKFQSCPYPLDTLSLSRLNQATDLSFFLVKDDAHPGRRSPICHCRPSPIRRSPMSLLPLHLSSPPRSIIGHVTAIRSREQRR